MVTILDSVDELEAKIGAFNELLETLKGCAARGRCFSIDEIQQTLSNFVGEDECPLLVMFLAIAIQRSVFA